MSVTCFEIDSGLVFWRIIMSKLLLASVLALGAGAFGLNATTGASSAKTAACCCGDNCNCEKCGCADGKCEKCGCKDCKCENCKCGGDCCEKK
jgi:hypothetical protein